MFGSELTTNRNERLLILSLCVAAALRVFIYSAAFPFFSNIDEDLHFDLITQYSHAQVPRSFDRLKDETLNWIVPYASPEFLFTPEGFPGGKFPSPLWKEPWAKAEPEIAVTRAAWSGEINFESSQPPLYYVLASAWWWIGKHIGLEGIQSMYWIRFLNVPLIAMLVWLGYVAARTIAPEQINLRIGVPLLLASLPQNVFYAMNNDVLSPICFGVLFLCVLQWLRTNSAERFVGSAHRSGDRCHVSGETVELTADRSYAGHSRRKGFALYPKNTSCRADHAWCTDFLFYNPDRQLDAVDETSFRGCHWIDSKNRFARLDAKTVGRVVAASGFYATRFLDLLVRFNRKLLARRSHLARPAAALASGRWILRDFIVAFRCCSYRRITKTIRAYLISATGDWKRSPDFPGWRCVSAAALDSIRFRQLYQSVQGTSLFHVGAIANRCAHSVRRGLCVWTHLVVQSDQLCFASYPAGICGAPCDGFGDLRQPRRVRERA